MSNEPSLMNVNSIKTNNLFKKASDIVLLIPILNPGTIDHLNIEYTVYLLQHICAFLPAVNIIRSKK